MRAVEKVIDFPAVPVTLLSYPNLISRLRVIAVPDTSHEQDAPTRGLSHHHFLIRTNALVASFLAASLVATRERGQSRSLQNRGKRPE